MKSEMRVFAVVGGFLIVVAAVYAWLTAVMTGGVERVGTTALVLSFLLCAMIGGSWWLISRRIEPRPEDREEAEPSDGAGDVGFFSPYSYWPILVGVGTATAAFGIAVWQFWIVGVGLVAVVFSAAGLLFEYYTGTTRGPD
jgi:hypothetical protein